MLLTRALEVMGSNLDRNTDYPEMYLMIFLILPKQIPE
jgi:hypothetical protein